MHEHGLMDDVFKVVKKTADSNNLKVIKTVKLKIGKLQQLIPENLEAAFYHICEHAGISGAKLEVDVIPIKAKCRKCGKEFVIDDIAGICPECGGTNLEIIEGRDVIVEKIIGWSFRGESIIRTN